MSSRPEPLEPVEPAPPQAREARSGRRSRSALPGLMAGGFLVAAAFAHRDLLTFRFRTTMAVPLSTDVENWFFEPSDTSPGLVLLFVLWLLWRRRGRLARTLGSPGSRWVTGLCFGLGLASFFWAVRAGAPELQVPAAFFNVLGVAHAFGGLAALRIACVPAVFLVFAMPVPAPLLNEVVWSFQIWTAEYAGVLLHALGQSAFVSGDQILQSDKVFQIIESCSGLRTIETLTMLTVLMVDLFRRRGLHAVALLLCAPLVAFGVNGFRALTLMFNPHSEVASIHNLQGIVMLLIGVLLLYGIDGVLERFLPTPRARRPARASGDVPPRALWVTGSVLAALIGLSFLSPWPLEARDLAHLADTIPREIDGYTSRDIETDRIFLGQAGFSQLLHREYSHGGRSIDVFAARATLLMRNRSFYSPKTTVPGSGWIVEESGVREIEGRQVLVRTVRRGTQRLLLYHWREGSAGLAGETLRAAVAIDSTPWRRQQVPVVVRLMAPVGSRPGSRAATEERLVAFLGELAPIARSLTGPQATPEG